MTHAEELMKAALADPQRALRDGGRLMAEPGGLGHDEQAEVLRAMSMAARHSGRIDDSIEYARQSADAGEAAGSDDLRLLGLLTMSGSLAIAGRAKDALDLIAEGVTARDPHLRARFLYQRATVLVNAGNVVEGVESYLEVLPVFRETGDTFSVGLTLNQLGRLHTSLGHLVEAEGYLTEALELALETQEHVTAHGIQHNLGLLAAYRGDLPLALDWLRQSDELYMRTSGAPAPQHVARSEVLISAGLFEEALHSARRIAENARLNNDREHLANAQAVAARAALLADRPEVAAAWSLEAADILADAGEAPAAAEARMLNAEARLTLDGPSQELLEQTSLLAGTLSAEGMVAASAQANFLCARIAAELDKPLEERRFLREVAELGAGPVEIRVQAAVARARIRLAEDEPVKALAAVRSGLDMLDRYQSALGATDLRLGVERHGADLAAMGLGQALDSGRPRRVLEWLDRGRARALRHRPVLPAGAGNSSEAMAALRRVEAELRKSANRGDEGMLRERRRLQDQIAAEDRLREGTGGVSTRFSVSALVDELDDRCLFEIGSHEGRLFAVMVKRGRARLVWLGAVDETSAQVRRVRFDMRRTARRGRDFRPDSLEALARGLLGDVALGDDALVVVPPPYLMSVPWNALPPLRDHPVTVSPSAEMWWRATQRVPSHGGVVVAGGPDLSVARAEVDAVGALYRECVVLPPGSTVEEVRSHLGGASVAHIVSHATFQVENPMFSSLRLGDGDLNVYDIERLDDPPDVMVLSACDSGYSETRSGDELAGLTSALLSMGTRSVVASVGLVPDASATSLLMVEFHEGLLAGLEPAQALARAQGRAFGEPESFVAAASFVCVGA